MVHPVLKSLSFALSGQDSIAYVQCLNTGKMEWTDDADHFLGLSFDGLPSHAEDYIKMLNPQDVPSRQSWIQDFLNMYQDVKGHDICPKGSSEFFRLKHGNGSHLLIKERISITEGSNGNRYLIGLLSKSREAALDRDNADISEIGYAGQVYSERLGLKRKIETLLAEKECFETGCILTVGIDHMRLHNENLGGRRGDELIEKTGNVLRRIVGDRSGVYRINGDVFGVMAPDMTVEEMVAMAYHIIQIFNMSPVQTSHGECQVGVSVGGVSLFCQKALQERTNKKQDSHKSAATLIHQAETALVTAKNKGRNAFMCYDDMVDLAQAHRKTMSKGNEFLDALRENRMMLAYQPVVASDTDEVVFYESLVRFADIDGKIVPAGYFIDSVEELGLSRLVDQFALQMVIEEMLHYPSISMSLNVSRRTLNDPTWLKSIVSKLENEKDVARRLIVEITESAVMDDVQNVQNVIQTLKELGCRIALDDFGAGHTSFAHLRNLHIDIVKIDKSFIRDGSDEQNKLFISTLKTLADGMQIQTIGEGAETEEDVMMLKHHGIDMIQGYAYDAPRVERLWLDKSDEHRKIALPMIVNEKAAKHISV